MQDRSPLRQLQLDAAITVEGFIGLVGIDRLKFTKAGGDQPLWRHALGDQILHDRDRARGRQLPVVLELWAVDRPDVGMAIDAQHPGDLTRYLLFQFKQRAGERIEFGATLGLVEGGLAGIEKYFRLEYEAVADDADIGSAAEDRAQSSEEVGPVPRQLLLPLGERHVEALAEVS